MSLKTLLQHKMTIQTAESASNASDGTLDRESAWTNTSFVNIACNIQEKTSATVDARFNKLDTYDDNKIYINSKMKSEIYRLKYDLSTYLAHKIL